MIKARHTRLGYLFFKNYTRYQLRRHFYSLELFGEPLDEGKAILMIANHFSWWDGFIQFYINEQTYGRQFHVMMLEEQLRQHPILAKTGAYSVKKNSKSLLESLQYSLDLLSDKNKLVLLFPQGEIQSLYQDKIHLGKGIEYLLKRCSSTVQCVMNVNLVDYGAHKKSTLSIYYKNLPKQDIITLEAIEKEYNQFYQACLQKQKERCCI